MTQDEIIEIWVTLVHKNTAGGACNFQQAAIDLAKLVATKEQEAIIDLVAFYGGPVDLEAAIRARGEA